MTAPHPGGAEGARAAAGPQHPQLVRTAKGAVLAGSVVGGAALAAHHEERPYLHSEAPRGARREAGEVARDRAFVHEREGRFHTRFARDFNPHELAAWRGGSWRREWHYGRYGWWWDIGDGWYPYDDPVYPYPLEVVPVQVYDEVVIVGPEQDQLYAVPGAAGSITVDGVATAFTIAPLPAPAPGWYRCENVGAYYPRVGACAVVWSLVQEPPPADTTP